jgi:hypothetical protein
MTKINYIFAIILSFYCTFTYCQKKPFAKAITNNITIDGRINEAEWENNSEIATDFIMFEPDNGRPISAEKDVKVLYNDDAVHISAIMYDNEPKIQRE